MCCKLRPNREEKRCPYRSSVGKFLHKLSISNDVTIPVTEAVWPQFVMQEFGDAVCTPGEMGNRREAKLVLQGSGLVYLLLLTVFRYTMHTLQTGKTYDRRTQHRAISATVSTVG